MKPRTQKDLAEMIDPKGDNGPTLARAYNTCLTDIIETVLLSIQQKTTLESMFIVERYQAENI